ncbi:MULTISPECIES: LemA family protein [Flavobacterium]|jgi:LemA protein|uniref:LemA family protein n=1 Tax=Flavobacterium cupriresistens TaxID=2893885 RepID=A0ABU4R9S7_9FLAO|nr:MULTISPECIES: LemA family protein [unclassified Flavobacterium]KLT68934.1 LemA family protein [Flavobacterium sp. ABG]MDX6188763.1 LemA family protein [Flavobacterium sp. Fl-318]UFH44451.1 LemA family protein [Flavobacterium sp. F-323]
MKKWLIPVGIIVVLVAIIAFWSIGIKNTGLKYSQAVNKEWGNVNTAYQRRNDLIGNLVNTVKGAADFEKSTLTAVIEARAKATSVTIDPSNVTPEQLSQFNQAQSGVSSSLSRLLVSVEQYPTLKANENFLKLQDELASTENQILTARTRFNESVQEYNGYILSIPNKWFLGEYKEKPYFQAVAGAEKPVEVKF